MSLSLLIEETKHEFITKFNIGGKHFETSTSTLKTQPNGLLYKIATTKIGADLKRTDGSFFIDRSAEFFDTILNFHRMGTTSDFTNGLPKDASQMSRLLAEANYYSLDDLIVVIKKQASQKSEVEKKLDVLFTEMSVHSALSIGILKNVIFNQRLVESLYQKDNCFSENNLDYYRKQIDESSVISHFLSDLDKLTLAYDKI